MTAIPERITEMFGGAEPLGASPKTTDEWRALVERGIPGSALAALSQSIAPDQDQARNLMYIVFDFGEEGNESDPLDWLENGPQFQLSVSESERAERIARMFALAESILGDRQGANLFLFSPHPKLDGARPIDWIRTELGGREVEQLLVNIREGFPA